MSAPIPSRSKKASRQRFYTMVRHLLTITTTTKILAGGPGSQTPAPFYGSVDIENPGLEAANSILDGPQEPRGRSGRVHFRPVWMDGCSTRFPGGEGEPAGFSGPDTWQHEQIEAIGAKLQRGPAASRSAEIMVAAPPPPTFCRFYCRFYYRFYCRFWLPFCRAKSLSDILLPGLKRIGELRD